MSGRSTLAQDAAAHLAHPLTRVLLALTFTTGMVDAASYLGLGRVFTANMTGNVVLLGFGLVGTRGLPVVGPLVSLSAFVLGSALGGALSRRLANRHPVHIGTALSIEVLMTGAAAILVAIRGAHPRSFGADVVIALLAFAMGVRNATVRRIAVPDLPTTVLTSTLTGLAADFSWSGGRGTGTARRGAAVLTMLLGAIAGALILKSSVALTLACAAAVPLMALVLYVGPRWRTAGQAA